MTMMFASSNPFQASKDNAMPFDPLPHMRDYLEQKAAEKRHPKHVGGIRLALIHFSTWARCHGIETQYDITRQHLVRYQGWVNTQDQWAKSYRVELMKRLRAWINWLLACGLLDQTPWVNIKVGYTSKTPNPLSDDELSILFHAHRQGAFSMSPFVFHRREMMLCLLYGWGLRIHELVALDLDDLAVNKDFVRAINKGSSIKTLPYSPEMKSIYRRWSSVRTRYATRDEPALLINNKGERLPDAEVYRTISDLGDLGGLRINPHRLRDTCGTNLLDSDVPVERVAEILGHKRIQQTLTYSRVNSRKVAESHRAAMDPRLSALFNGLGRTTNLLPEG